MCNTDSSCYQYTSSILPVSDLHSPILTFLPSAYCSWRSLLRCSRSAGVERVISLWGMPRSSSRVLIWPWNSRLHGCFNTATRWSFRFFLTLLTWDLASVGGRFAGRFKKKKRLYEWKKFKNREITQSLYYMKKTKSLSLTLLFLFMHL